ncbi:MAG: ABC transporter ATP-binding protein [Gammaproteobacteria bacterium]|nr:ABC transporter ATP-binding protein [Gammaproteobacteria bacterium]
MTDTVLTLDNVFKGFDGAAVLKGISAQVQSGEVIGLLGINGAGKTTLLETILGYALPDAGTVSLFGVATNVLHDESLKHRIGFVPQRDELLDQMTGRQFIELVARFYDHWNQPLLDRLAQEFDVPLDVRASKLSVGQRQKLSILVALGHEPELIFLDEPVASLDPLARRRFLQTLIDLVAEGDRTILFSTHIVSDLERVANRVWLIKDGLLKVDAALDELKERTVRITLPPGAAVSDTIRTEETLIHLRHEQESAVMVFSHWDAARHDLLARQTNGMPEPQHLSLEEIFLELHR